MKKKSLLIFFLLVWAFMLSALKVESVKFSGNTQISEKELASVIITSPGIEFNQGVALEDTRRLSEYYRQKGYYLARIDYPEAVPIRNNGIIVSFFIEEGKRLKITDIVFIGNNYISSSKLSTEITSPLQFLEDVDEYLEEILSYYNNNGFWFASVEVDDIEFSGADSLRLSLRISEGDYCRFKDYIFSGNTVTREETLLRLSRLNEQKLFSPQYLKQAQTLLESRPYIKKALILPANNHTLSIDITEGRMTAFTGIIGYNNSAESASRFTGYLDLDFENLWGTDRSVGFFWENRENTHSAVELNYHESGYKYPLAADIKLYREEVDSTWIEVSYDLEVYWYDLYNRYGIYWQNQNIYAGARRPVIIAETEFIKLGGFWKYSNLEHYSNPRYGSKGELLYYYIISHSESKNSDRQAVELQYERYIEIWQRWVAAGRINAKIIENKDLTEFDTFKTGGAGSIRGFLDKQFTGYRIAWVNLELRYILNRESRISLNVDLGNIESLAIENKTVFSLGAGLRTGTPVGELSVDIALPGDESGFGKIMEAIIHFGLQTRF